MQDFNILEGGASAAGYPFRETGPGEAESLPHFRRPERQGRFPRRSSRREKQADLIFLSAAQDGLDQIARHLRGRGRLSLIHLLAAFSLGRLALGKKVLVIRSLRDYVATLARIGRTVRGGGEIVIGAGGVRDGQGDNFRRAFESYAAVPSASGTAPRTADLVHRTEKCAHFSDKSDAQTKSWSAAPRSAERPAL